MTNDTTPAPQAVTPEQVAAKARSTAEKGASSYGSGWLPAHVCELLMETAAMLEALAADRDAQKARADAAERRFANSERMLTQAETKLTAAEAKVARLAEHVRLRLGEALAGLSHAEVSQEARARIERAITAAIAEVQG